MTVDIFVHPTYPERRLARAQGIGFYQRYLAELEKIAGNSRYACQLETNPEESLLPGVDQDNKFRSYTGKLLKWGWLSPEDWPRFVEMLQGQSDIRIHGAHFSECCYTLAFQMAAYLSHGVQFDSVMLEEHELLYSSGSGRISFVQAVAEDLIEQGTLAASRVRFGTVFSNREPTIEQPNGRSPGSGLFQLIDKETTLFLPTFNGDGKLQRASVLGYEEILTALD